MLVPVLMTYQIIMQSCWTIYYAITVFFLVEILIRMFAEANHPLRFLKMAGMFLILLSS